MKLSIVVAFTLFIPLFSIAQIITNQDSVRRLQFGFMLGVNYSQIETSEGVNKDDYFLENEMGFTLGILAEYEINPKLKSINTMETSFYNGSVTYVDNLYLRHQKLEWTNLEIGTRLNWHPFKREINSPYITLGPEIQFDLSKGNNINQLRPKYIINAGFGMDTQLKYFKFTPEILYSYGLSEVDNIGLLPAFKIHTIALMLYFKG